MWVNITFLISPLCRVQTFQTPCIYLRSHISPGFLWPSSSLQLFPKKVFQLWPPAPARQGIGHTFVSWKRLPASFPPFSNFGLQQKFASPCFFFQKHWSSTAPKQLLIQAGQLGFLRFLSSGILSLDYWLLATDYWLLAVATPPVAL